MTETERTISTWTAGDYAVIESWIGPASRAVLDSIDFESQPNLLDVACGMGAVAIEAATRGARVTGLDLTPKMLRRARARAERAQVSVRWIEGSFDDLTHLGSFDVVVSAFGVIFSSEPQRTARQVASICRPGGRIVLTSWHRDGAFGGFEAGAPLTATASLRARTGELAGAEPADPEAGMRAIREFASELPEGPTPDRWSDEATLSSFFEGTAVRLVEIDKREMSLSFPSVTGAFEALLRHSGPWQQLMAYFESIGKAAPVRRALEDYLATYATPTNEGIRLYIPYVLSTLERR